MWHLKTKFGTFWIVEGEDKMKGKFFLGVDDTELGEYASVEDAIENVCQQQTGYLHWDSLSKISIPKDLDKWHGGEPLNWDS